jgi:hypothetical protein
VAVPGDLGRATVRLSLPASAVEVVYFGGQRVYLPAAHRNRGR